MYYHVIPAERVRLQSGCRGQLQSHPERLQAFLFIGAKPWITTANAQCQVSVHLPSVTQRCTTAGLLLPTHGQQCECVCEAPWGEAGEQIKGGLHVEDLQYGCQGNRCFLQQRQ